MMQFIENVLVIMNSVCIHFCNSTQFLSIYNFVNRDYNNLIKQTQPVKTKVEELKTKLKIDTRIFFLVSDFSFCI